MRKLLILVFCFLSGYAVWAQPSQDRVQMERERQRIQQEIKEIQSEYNKVRGKTKATIGQLSLIQQKVEVQGRYIGNINREIKTINDEIYLSNLEINRLQVQLDTLKLQYARSVVYAYKNTSSYDYLNFIFSANNFNDALKRVSYLKSYRAYRQQQASNILETQKMIQERKQQLQGKNTQKKEALQNQQQQLAVLEDQKKEKDAVVSKLKSQEKELNKELAVKKKRDNQLKGQIAAVIRREIEAARKAEAARLAELKRKEEEARKRDAAAAAANAATAGTSKTTTPSTKPATTTPATTKPKSYLDLNAKDVALNASFEKNRGSLPWPVDNGVVTIPFGRSRVGQLDFDNAGITISTPSAGTPVKAIFDGEVSAVSNLGDGMMVMIRHGKYFTVYSNLSSASVSKGQQVRTGQAIGRAAEADDGSGGQLDLILMMETRNINPQPWLRR